MFLMHKKMYLASNHQLFRGGVRVDKHIRNFPSADKETKLTAKKSSSLHEE